MAFSARQMQSLRRALETSRRMKQAQDRHRMRALQQYVGFHYSDNGSTDRVPINLIEQAVSIYVRNLAAEAPATLVNTKLQHLRPTAAEYSKALSDLAIEINLAHALQVQVLESLISPMGIIKCGITSMDGAQGFLHDAGQPFADPVAWEDWAHDMSVKHLEQCNWFADRYMLTVQDAERMFNGKAMDQVTAMVRAPQDDMGMPRSNVLTAEEGQQEHLRDHVELWDVWLPRENLLVTLHAESAGAPLRVVEADQPEGGPYHLLWYTDVPGNTMPLPPVAVWMDLHDLTNRIFRKLSRQAERHKVLTVVQDAAVKDGQRVQSAEDGEVIRSSRPEATKEARYGGVDNNVFAFVQYLEGEFHKNAGNLETLGGLGPSSTTFAQDEMLSDAAHQRIKDMQSRVLDRTAKLMKHLAWYEWTDPQRTRRVIRTIPGTHIEVTTEWSKETREGDFLDYDFEIEPHSMQKQSPGERVAGLANVFDRFVAPYLPLLEQQGIGIDYEELFKTIGRYTNLPELERIIIFNPPTPRPEDPQQKGDPRASASPVTSRKNVTENRTETTPAAQRAKNIQSLMSASNGSS